MKELKTDEAEISVDDDFAKLLENKEFKHTRDYWKDHKAKKKCEKEFKLSEYIEQGMLLTTDVKEFIRLLKEELIHPCGEVDNNLRMIDKLAGDELI